MWTAYNLWSNLHLEVPSILPSLGGRNYLPLTFSRPLLLLATLFGQIFESSNTLRRAKGVGQDLEILLSS